MWNRRIFFHNTRVLAQLLVPVMKKKKSQAIKRVNCKHVRGWIPLYDVNKVLNEITINYKDLVNPC